MGKSTDFILFARKKNGQINAMTCGWVTDGILYNRKVKMVYVRKTRYTYEFLMDADYFFTAEVENQELYDYFGSVSGRDEDKIKKADLHILQNDGKEFLEGGINNTYLKKIAVLDFSKADYLDPQICEKFREDDEAHVIFVGEVI